MNTVTNQNAGDVLNYIFKYLIKVELENTQPLMHNLSNHNATDESEVLF